MSEEIANRISQFETRLVSIYAKRDKTVVRSHVVGLVGVTNHRALGKNPLVTVLRGMAGKFAHSPLIARASVRSYVRSRVQLVTRRGAVVPCCYSRPSES